MTDRIDVLVTARNQTSGALNQVKQELSGLDDFASKLNAGLSGIGAIAGIGAVVAGLQQIGAEIDALGRRGAIFEQLDSVLNSYASKAGQVGEAFVEAGRRASAGTIGDYDLILNANRALQFEVAGTSEQYAKLIELATALGRAQGISDTQSLEYLTTGIARESKMILDNLGLIIDLDSATSAYAGTIGKTAGELTTAERKQAILNEAFKQGATAIEANREASDSAATNFERMDASIQNAKDNLGELFAPAVAVVAKNIADAAQAASEQLNNIGKGMSVDDAIGKINGLQNILAGLDAGRAQLESNRGNPGFDQTTLFEVIAKQREAQEQLNQAQNEYFAALRQMYPAQAQSADAMNRTNLAAEAQVNILRMNAEAAAATGASFDPLNVATNSLARETDVLNAALQGAPGWMSAMASEALAAGGSILEVADDVRILKGEIDRLEGAKSGIRNAVIRAAIGVKDIVGGSSQALALAQQQIGEMDFAIAALGQRLKDGTISQTEFDFELANLNDTATESFDAITDADRAAKQLAREGLSAAKKAANEAEQAFESLKGKVAGVLQGALDPGVGVDVNTLLKDGVKVPDGKQPKPEDFLLPREDAINENARRLADVAVKGFESPWLEYFKTAWPDLYNEMFADAQSNDSVRKTAAMLLQNFEDGLNPELIDKGRAKDRIKRMLLGETRMEELAQEIASELAAEFGGSISLGKIQAAANSALGVDGGNQVQLAQSLSGIATEAGGQAAVIGGNIRSGIVSALDGIGETVAIALDKQFRAENNLKTINAAGATSGEAWGSGFLSTMDSLTTQVLEKLASLVSPYVEATQARNATLNGAN